MSSAQYVIPPYLLNTCLGLNLLRQLSEVDQTLATTNLIFPNSPFYSKDEPVTSSPLVFLYDRWIDQIVREKVYHKLSALGVLGSSPPPPQTLTTEYLKEMLDNVRDQLDDDESDSDVEFKDSHSHPYPETHALPTNKRLALVGEIIDHDTNVPSEYARLVNLPLGELLKVTKVNDLPFQVPARVVTSQELGHFPFILPYSWLPLIPTKSLEILNRDYNFNIDHSHGYSTIEIATQSGMDRPEKLSSLVDLGYHPKFYNFISDKDVCPSMGIFYYEVEVEQQTTEATNFKPVLTMNDPLILLNQCLRICLGFARRQFLLDGLTMTAERVDLNQVRRNFLAKDRKRVPVGSQLEVLELILSQKPGEMRGSFAVNFLDLVFYNSIKCSDANQRQALLINRRLRNSLLDADQGRIDLGVPFKTKLEMSKSLSKHRTFITDVIGCGINFIDKSIFFTVNGVMARIITNDELVSSAMVYDNLFAPLRKQDQTLAVNSVFPIIGFELGYNGKGNEANDPEVSSPPSTCKIRTNFGFNEFKFNINNYVKNYKTENERFLDQLERDQLGSQSTAPSVQTLLAEILDPTSQQGIENLIKDYLVHEGYIETFKSFSSDLKPLHRDLGETLGSRDELLLAKSNAQNRKLIKQYLTNHQFDLLIKFLQLNYSAELATTTGEEILFQVHFLKLVWLMTEILKNKFDGKDFTSVHDEAFAHCTKLRQDNIENPTRMTQIEELASLFLVSNAEKLKLHLAGAAMLNDFKANIRKLFEMINSMILLALGFNRVLHLETIIKSTNLNISKLSLEFDDDKFMLVNFEQDHLDL